jgi:hypothetical protein
MKFTRVAVGKADCLRFVLDTNGYGYAAGWNAPSFQETDH